MVEVCTRKTQAQDLTGSACPECTHWTGVHPFKSGANGDVDECLVCRLLALIEASS